jgi:5'-nucleotidase
MKTILVTNDDGIYGPGLPPLIKELKKLGKVVAVVPDQERSGTSHSITLHKPFRVQELGAEVYIANGTPADCVRYGARWLIKGKVDLVVSGINTGPNLGQDVIYSGTVAGAREGALLKIPSFAVSVADVVKGDFKLAATVAGRIARKMLRSSFPADIYLNVNVPNRVKGVKITSVGRRIYDETIECRTDPRGKKYYWLAGKFVKGESRQGSDINTVKEFFVSVTPLQLDPTARTMIGVFEQWKEDLN